MVETLKVKDCFKYKKPKNHLVKKGDVLPAASTYYKSYAELLEYTSNCINDCKNLLKIQEHHIKLIIKALKNNDIVVEYNPLEYIDD